MNRRDDHAGPLFVTDSCEEGRNRAYGRLSKDLLRLSACIAQAGTKEQVRARQYL